MALAVLAQRRLFAWVIDVLIVFGLGLLFARVGWLAGAAYWLLRDGFFEGQSIGKRLMGLKVVVGEHRARCRFSHSALRNLLWGIPILNLVMGFIGLQKLFRDRAGRHWGDRLADTRVVVA